MYWAPNGTLGGSGNWDSSTTAWSGNVSGSSPYYAWINGDTAVFSGTAGTANVDTTGITASAIDFSSSGFTIGSSGGGNISPVSGGMVIAVNSGLTATISAAIGCSGGIGSGLTLTSGGGLTLSNSSNNYSGPTNVNSGTL